MLDSITLYTTILWPALLAGIVVLSTHVPLGQEVLHRGIIFLDLAIAQVAALGLIFAGTLGIETDTYYGNALQQAVAIGSAMIGAMLLYQCRHLQAKIQEALIGILFMLAATGSILLLAADPHGGERLKELLVGQILWVKPSQLLWVAICYIAVLSIWFTLRRQKGEWIFYPLFAITITLSTQLVGVYLVFASLIIPALATLQQQKPLVKAYSIGFLAYLTGLLLSAIWDVPSGAMITWCLAAYGALVFFIFQRKVHV